MIPVEERFFQRLGTITERGCTLFRQSYKSHGYGAIRLCGRKSKLILAHRLAYELFIGSIPDGMCVCHRCDVRDCVNPAHLFLGTKIDNARDRDAKGRQPRGDTHGGAKLTARQVRTIRAERAAGASYRELARKYGVNSITVGDVIRGRSWGHLELPG